MNMNLQVITTTNYTGEARNYLRRLIEVMGARFTPNLCTKTNLVVAAR